MSSENEGLINNILLLYLPGVRDVCGDVLGICVAAREIWNQFFTATWVFGGKMITAGCAEALH